MGILTPTKGGQPGPKRIDGAPLFAVEIRSPGDDGPKMDDEYATKRQM